MTLVDELMLEAGAHRHGHVGIRGLEGIKLLFIAPGSSPAIQTSLSKGYDGPPTREPLRINFSTTLTLINVLGYPQPLRL